MEAIPRGCKPRDVLGRELWHVPCHGGCTVRVSDLNRSVYHIFFTLVYCHFKVLSFNKCGYMFIVVRVNLPKLFRQQITAWKVIFVSMWHRFCGQRCPLLQRASCCSITEGRRSVAATSSQRSGGEQDGLRSLPANCCTASWGAAVCCGPAAAYKYHGNTRGVLISS